MYACALIAHIHIYLTGSNILLRPCARLDFYSVWLDINNASLYVSYLWCLALGPQRIWRLTPEDLGQTFVNGTFLGLIISLYFPSFQFQLRQFI